MERLNHSFVRNRIPSWRGTLAASKAAGCFRVDPGRPLHLGADTYVAVEVVEGRIWLTAAGDSRDHFPSAGACLEFVAGSDVLIEAEGGPALVEIRPVLRAADDGPEGLAPGRPLLDVGSLVDRTVHGFLPAKATSLPCDGDGSSPLAGSLPHASMGGPTAGVTSGIAAWFRARLDGLRSRWVRARAQRLLTTLDSRQLRDIGAPDHVILYRERLEREARMRDRMMSGGV